MGRFLLCVAALGLIAGCHSQPRATLAVHDTWVRLPAVPGRPAAAYFSVTGGPTADRLVGVQSAKAERAELHAGGMSGGMATMRPMSGIDIPAGGHVDFAPGGNHAMLFGVDRAIAPGGDLPLRFHFASGTTIEVQADARGAADTPPHEH